MKPAPGTFLRLLALFSAALLLGDALLFQAAASHARADYARRYRDLSGQAAAALSQVDRLTDDVMTDALYALRERDRASGLPSDEDLRRLKDRLGLDSLAVTDRGGRFIRSSWGRRPRLAPLFSYCAGYRDLLSGRAAVETTPILTSGRARLPYKYVMIADAGRRGVLEADMPLRSVGEAVERAVGPDANVRALGLFSPSGALLGWLRRGPEPAVSAQGAVFTAKVETPAADCCECRLKGLTGPDGRYYYVLRMEVSAAPLARRLAGLRRAAARAALGALLLAGLAAFLLARRLALADAADQLAHDLRSPLAALDSALGTGRGLPEPQRAGAESAVRRLRAIAEEALLRRSGAPAASGAQVCGLAALVEPLVAEKRLRFGARPGLRIEADLRPDVFARVEPAPFLRALSNLIDNGVEALEGAGRVEIALERRGGQVEARVVDDGRGIPAGLLGRLGRRGATFGKPGGRGLGLSHARACARAWGGSLALKRRPGGGTQAALLLPAAAPDAALVDDDALVRSVWRQAARRAGKTLAAFGSPEELLAAAAGLDKSAPVYVDAELGGGARGTELAARLRGEGFSRVYLATGHAPALLPAMPWLCGIVGKEAPWARPPGGMLESPG